MTTGKQGEFEIDISQMKKAMNITPKTVRHLKRIGTIIEPRIDGLLDTFYGYIEDSPLLSEIVKQSGASFPNLRETLSQWALELFTSKYGKTYAERRMRIGRRHVEIGLDHKYVIVALNLVRKFIQSAIIEEFSKSPEDLLNHLEALNKILDLDAALITSEYTTGREVEAVRPIMDTVKCMIVGVDKKFLITDFNAYAENLTGYLSAEVTGKNFFDLFLTAKEAGRIKDEFRNILKGTYLNIGYENVVITKTSQRRLLRWNAAKRKGQGGIVTGIVAVGQDITEQRQLQHHISEMDKLISMGRLAAGVAHDIKSPLNSIRLTIDDAIDTTSIKDIRELLGTVPGSIKRISGLVEQMLDLTKPRTGVKQPVLLNTILESCLEIICHDHRSRNVTIRHKFVRPGPRIHGDKDALLHAFLNLLLNGVDAAGSKGGTVILQTLLQDNDICIRCEDNGIGIPEDMLDMIFHPYVTTKSEKGGTGLGLWIAESIISEHDGRIEVKSSKGNGTVFNVYIPVLK